MTHKQKPEREEPRESRQYLGAGGGVSQQGRTGGRLARDIGTRDEIKRAQSRPAGKTGVRKSDEKQEDIDK